MGLWVLYSSGVLVLRTFKYNDDMLVMWLLANSLMVQREFLYKGLSTWKLIHQYYIILNGTYSIRAEFVFYILNYFIMFNSIQKLNKNTNCSKIPPKPPPPSSCLKCEILWCSFWFVPDMRMVLTSYCFCAFLPPLLGLCNGELSLWHLFFFSTIIVFFFHHY